MIETRFTESFGCRYPIQQAGMGGFTTPALALAVAAAGGFGMLSGTMSARALAEQLDAVPPSAPIGVNFLVPFLDPAALEEASSRAPLVEFFWGVPDAALVDVARQAGARAGWQVGSVDEALAAQDAGCDIIVVQGHEAGGHVRGTVDLLPLLADVRARIELPLIATGGIGTGRAVAAALAGGADAVRIGTRFVAAQESVAHPVYVEALISARAEDTVVTTAFGEGWPDAPHRVLKSCIDAGRALGDAQSWVPTWPRENDRGPVNARTLYAGESVGAVQSRQSAAEIIEELVRDARNALSAG
jgi:NAD(P)H-dependent flavin oxidoreductase YrpB (nitropropane dioxygenase family)